MSSTIRVKPMHLLGVLRATSDVQFTIDAHRIPRAVFDAIEGVEERVEPVKGHPYWSKRLLIDRDVWHLFCEEPPAEGEG